jgi:alcohol dehydrogenase (cytochrome c)
MVTRAMLIFLASVLGLCETGCAHRGSPLAVQSDRGRGAAIFAKNCSVCHTAAGSRIGPPLERVGRTLPLDRIERIVEDPDPPMPKLYPSVLSRQDVDDVSAYVKTL